MLHKLPFFGNTPSCMLTQLLSESYIFLSSHYRMQAFTNNKNDLPLPHSHMHMHVQKSAQHFWLTGKQEREARFPIMF